MPQCMKCGKEISQYGLCARCKAAAPKPDAKPEVKRVVVCPNCGSRYCKKADEGYKCNFCGTCFR